MNDDQFRQLLDRFGLSWHGYRKVRKGVKKRLGRHMQTLGCRSMEEYLRLLARNPDIARTTELLLTVSISHFFRDRLLWDTLGKEIIPRLIGSCGDSMRVWSAGCALGQEVYSFKILWHLLESEGIRLPELDLRATDVNPDYLDKARRGIYPANAVRAIPAGILSRYFTVTPDGLRFTVTDTVRHTIVWEIFDLTRDIPPHRVFHIILLRNNLLTYYNRKIRTRSFHAIMEGLAEGGYLIIGSHETLPFTPPDLVGYGNIPYIFQKLRLNRSPVKGPT
jgi:chemotaxis protein methyltransferase CheR